MKSNVSEKCREELIIAMSEVLNTTDKRYMFLRLEFPKTIPYINIEGCPYDASWNIFLEFEKMDIIGSLLARLNSKLNLQLNVY